MPSGLICNGWSGPNQDGVSCILPSTELGSKIKSKMPEFPTNDQNYRIYPERPVTLLALLPSHPRSGDRSLAMCVGTYLPSQMTY
jgi:hypothetical protein